MDICCGTDRKLRSSGNESSKHEASKSGSSSGYPSAAPGVRVVEETVTRCPCGSNVETGTMIQVSLPITFCRLPFNTFTFVLIKLHLFHSCLLNLFSHVLLFLCVLFGGEGDILQVSHMLGICDSFIIF